MSFESELRLALGEAADLPHLPQDTFSRLEALDRLLAHWSGRVDLIGFRSREERMRRYFAEPLKASSWLPPEGLALDIGSGGGSPGLVFAVARSGLSWELLEPRRKKGLFLEEAIRELGIGNARVVGQRFEPRTITGAWLAVSTRGVRLTRPLQEAIADSLAEGGRFLWLSSEAVLREGGQRFAAREGFRVEGPHRLLSTGGSCLLVVEKAPGKCFT